MPFLQINIKTVFPAENLRLPVEAIGKIQRFGLSKRHLAVDIQPPRGMCPLKIALLEAQRKTIQTRLLYLDIPFHPLLRIPPVLAAQAVDFQLGHRVIPRDQRFG